MQDLFLNFSTKLSDSLIFPQLIVLSVHHFITLTFLLNTFNFPSTLLHKWTTAFIKQRQVPTAGAPFKENFPMVAQRWTGMLLCSQHDFI